MQEHLLRTWMCGWGLTRVNPCPRVWLIFLTFFFDCSEPRGITCLLPLQAKPLCRPSQPWDRSPPAAPVPSYIITWESPSDICQDLYFPWKLPPFKSASLVAHLKSPSTTEFKTVGFKRLHVRQAVRSTWQVSVTTTPMQPENAASPQPGVSGPCTPFSTLLRALTASSAWAAVSHVVPALATEHLESCW